MENKNNILQVENILLDVRKAYRLLYSYQRKVLDLMKFIGYLTTWNYEGGWCKFSDPSPKNGKGVLDSWAWDWLNLYTYEFHFGFKEINGSKIKFSVWLVSDTGFYDSDSKDKRNVETFSSVEESATKLIFVVGKNIWHTSFPDFLDNLKKTKLIEKKESTVGNEVLLVKSFNLSSFINADEARKRTEELVSYFKENGIPEFTTISSVEEIIT